MPTGTNSTLWPKRWIAAKWLKLYSGPKKAMRGSRISRAAAAGDFAQQRLHARLRQRGLAGRRRQPRERFGVERRRTEGLGLRRILPGGLEHERGPALARVGSRFSSSWLILERRASGRRGVDLRFVPADSAAFVFDLAMIAPIRGCSSSIRGAVLCQPVGGERAVGFRASQVCSHNRRWNDDLARYAEA